MIRKLIVIAATILFAGIACAQIPVSFQTDANVFWVNGPYRTTSGPVAGTNYGMDAVWNGTGWTGVEWGSGNGTVANTNIPTNMATMGILVEMAQGTRITLNHRFYEMHPGVVHDDAGVVMTATFEGQVGTNFPILFGLNPATTGGSIQFAGSGGPEVLEIRGELVDSQGTHQQTWAPHQQVVFQHNFCNAQYKFEVDVKVPVHMAAETYILPFYLCPNSTF